MFTVKSFQVSTSVAKWTAKAELNLYRCSNGMETYSQEFAQASESGELMKDRLQLIEHRAGDKVYKDPDR